MNRGDDGHGDDSDEVPCPPLFATETMAELSARQGRAADAVAIYRHLIRTAEQDPDPDGAGRADRLEIWRARLAELENAGARPAASPASAAASRQAPPPPPAPAAGERASLVIREPVRSGQVVYAEGRDLIVVAPVHPGSQLLADGHVHVYGPLKGRAVAGARGRRDAEVFCLALESELVGVDAGYLVSDQIPAAVWGGPARVFLSADGTCTVASLVGRAPSLRLKDA